MTYVICLGSNVQQKENLAMARQRLREYFPEICFAAEEQTQPVQILSPALFLNQVACFTSDLHEMEVTSYLKSIEREAGRNKEDIQKNIVKLDIDLLCCDRQILKPADMKRDYVSNGLRQLTSCPVFKGKNPFVR